MIVDFFYFIQMSGQRKKRVLNRVFRQMRVRVHGNLARIEVPSGEIPRFAEPSFRQTITARFQDLGFSYVTLDLLGFRSGSMNETLKTS